MTARVAVVGGGPAGLMAAEVLLDGGMAVDLYDHMPSLGRKFLMAGKGGLNLTHSEPLSDFLSRFGDRRRQMQPLLEAFDPARLRQWTANLGVDTFVGSSGRVFPVDKKAAPLLRAWLHRLRTAGLHIHVRHRWLGWNGDALRFATPAGESALKVDAVVLALGGGSWAKLGSDGAWVPILVDQGIPVAPLKPSNCGFDVGWSAHFRERCAGQAVKSALARFAGRSQRGEFVVTTTGVEGGLIYTFSAAMRGRIEAEGSATLELDLMPDWSAERLFAEVTRPRGSRSLSSHLQSRLGLTGVKAGLLRECLGAPGMNDLPRLASSIKGLPLRLIAPRPLDEAISSAGGVDFAALDATLMLRERPGVFCAGEMLDWEAPTGGYLLTACLASGAAAGRGCLAWLQSQPR